MKDNFNDFFDEELKEKQGEKSSINYHGNEGQGGNGSAMHDIWSSMPPSPQGVQARSRRRLTVLLACISLVLVFSLGYLVSQLFYQMSDEQVLLQEVLDTLRNDFYYDITDEQWTEIVKNGGSAMFQTVDKYGHLLSPEEAYNLFNVANAPTASSYGMSLVYVAGVGFVVDAVLRESNAVGRMQEGDIIIALDNLSDNYGNAVNLAGTKVSEKVLTNQYTDDQLNQMIAESHSATFTVLRGTDIVDITFSRGSTGSINNLTDKFSYVSYYFGDSNTNMSTTVEPGRAVSSKDALCLYDLPTDAGYLYISQFSNVGGDVSDEVDSAMRKFLASGRDRLIIDVKGNPGGDVGEITTIASHFATDKFLPAESRNKVTSVDKKIIATKLIDKYGNSSDYTVEGKYSTYFCDPVDDVKNIIIFTDKMSASASEMLTGIVTELGVAVQMGTTTYGKGIAQTILPISGYSDTISTPDGDVTENWYLYFTVAEYLSPLGNNIHGVGYTPESAYNNLTTYDQLFDAVNSYWG